ncbi:unnamed protein product [Brassica rapa subsp. narinosa]
MWILSVLGVGGSRNGSIWGLTLLGLGGRCFLLSRSLVDRDFS